VGTHIPRRGIWQAEVASRVGELDGRLKAVEGRKQTPGPTAEETAIMKSVEERLEVAKAATDGADPWSQLKSWWTGAAITEAWESVHNAELSLAGIESKQAVRATVPRLLAWVKSTIDDRDRRDLHAEALKEQIDPATPLDRVKVRGALMDVIAANRTRYGNLRVFRNVLIVVTGLLAFLIVVAAGWHALNPSFLSLCPQGSKSCLTVQPRSEVALVALLGAIGGSLALAFGLAETASLPSRYDPKVWQAFLKPVTGAVTGVLGVMLIQAEFLVVTPAGNKSYVLLVYAVIFGFSQQLFTRTVDKKADELSSPASKSK
jgi:hypothetical protein